MRGIQPAYVPPVANTVRKYLKLGYLTEKTKLVEELKEQEAVAITSDCSTRHKKSQGFITATAHYIDINWIMRHPVLATRRIVGQHTAIKIHEALNDITKEFNINHKVAGLTTDNASNMKKAGRLQVFNTCPDAAVSCMAHTLQLAVQDGLDQDEIEQAAREARDLVGHFNRLNLQSDALEQYQLRQNPDKTPLTLIQDVCTRWNSMYFMFERLVQLRSAVYAILHDKKYTKPADCEKLEISNVTWNLIEKLLPAFKPMVYATEALASESYPSVSCIVHMITGLIKNELAPQPDDTETIQTFKVKVIVGLRSRFTLPDEPSFAQSAIAISMLLDPRHKNLSVIEDPRVKEQLQNVIGSILKAQDEGKTKIKEEAPSPAKIKKSVASYLEGDFSDDEQEDNIECELKQYIQEKVSKRSAKNPLIWWKVNEAKFPNVAKMARKCLCIMGTSVPSERVFSIAGLTVTKTRSNIEAESLDQIIFMNKALKRKYAEQDEESKKQNTSFDFNVQVKEEFNQAEPLDTSDKPPLPSLY